MNKEIIIYLKLNLKTFLNLLYIKSLRLYSIKQLHFLKFVNKDWISNLFGTLFALNLNKLFGHRLTKHIIKIYDDKKENEKARQILSIVLSIIYVTFLKFLYWRIFFNKNILDSNYLQVTIISILSITFYTIIFKPFFTENPSSKFIDSLINDTILLLSSDFITDAKIDSNFMDIEINTMGTFFRIILNSLISI